MPDTSPDPNKPAPLQPGLLLLLVAGIMGTFLVTSMLENSAGPTVQTVAYSDLKAMIREGDVASAVLEQHSVTLTIGDPDLGTAEKFRAVTPTQSDPELLPLACPHRVVRFDC